MHPTTAGQPLLPALDQPQSAHQPRPAHRSQPADQRDRPRPDAASPHPSVGDDRDTTGAAQALLQRRRRRARLKAELLELALAEERRRTEARLARQRRVREELARDERLNALLGLRERGVPVEQAIAEVERRFAARAAVRPEPAQHATSQHATAVGTGR